MLALPGADVLAALVSGLPLLLLGLVLLWVRPRRAATLAFAAFALLWGAQVILGNLGRIADLAGDGDGARRWILYDIAVFVCLPIPLAYFASAYPSRRGVFARRPLAAGLLLLPPAMGALALVFAPALLHRGASSPRPGEAAWGPLFPLFSVLFFAAYAYAICALHRCHARAARPIEARRTLHVLLGLLLFLSYDSVENLVYYAGARGGMGALYVLVSLASLALLAWVVRGLLLRPRQDVPVGRRTVAGAFLVPAAFGLLSGYSKVAPTVVPFRLDTVGLWRTASVALIAYAILRLEFFDIEAKLKRGAIAAFLFGSTAIAAIVVEQAIERIAGSAGLAVTVTQFLLLGGVGFVVMRTPRASEWLSRRILSRLDAAQHQHARRLEVYEAALAQAAAGTGAGERPLVDLRRRLRISDAEHRLVARLVAPATDDSLLAARYRVQRLLGEGAHGRAHLAHDLVEDREVVVKVVGTHALGGRAARLLLREAKILEGIRHPNVVALLGSWETPREACLVMEYVDGGNLLAHLRRRGALPLDEAVPILDQVLAGLGAAHARGVVHRDLKPENVLLTRAGVAKLADFGVARAARLGATGIEAGAVGTLSYMSPEQVRGADDVDGRSDLYAAGALFHHMLTGRHYLQLAGRDDFEIRKLVLEGEPRLATLREPPWVGRFLRRALAKAPDARFADAAAMRAALGGRSLEQPPVA